MNRSSPHTDEDQDSLFGSPPPSPARGRSPSQETFVTGKGVGPIVAVPSAGVGRKNVGTIALPGSHMSCAELPANLPASGLSLPSPTSSRDSPRNVPPNFTGMPTSAHTPVVASQSSTCSVPSRTASATSNIPSTSTSTSTRKRRTSKTKSLTPAPSAPPITLPGPNEPTPPNLLRSQSSLLGLAGLVGCVKPAQLHTHGSQSTLVQQSRSHPPSRGSTPAHPIVLDDDQDTPQAGKHRRQLQVPQGLDQLNPEVFRTNITASLTKEKNIFPVLESMIKLLGGEPRLPSATPPPQSFARPYGYGVFNAQSPPPLAPHSAPSSSTAAPTAPPPKRRKLKHVPAGAVDWDVPFPFATGEGPEAYHDTWARDRAKELVTQLLELVQNATRRATIKTAKSRASVSEGRTRAQKSQSSRSGSVETQVGGISSAQANIRESSLYTRPNPDDTMTGTPKNASSTDNLGHCVGLLESITTIDSLAPGPKDSVPVDAEGVVEECGSAVPCDYPAFEEWLSQLQQFVPFETGSPTPESDWGSRSSVSLDSSTSNSVLDILAPMQRDALIAPHAIRDEVIDPALLALSQQAGSTPLPQSPTSSTSMPVPVDVPDVSLTPPVLAHSPRTSLSSLTEPLTPFSEAFADVPPSMTIHQDLVRDPPNHPPVEKGHHSQAQMPSSPTESSEPPRITAVQKGEGRAGVSAASPAPSTSSRSTPSAVSTVKGALDKQAILERARERRRELVAGIERAKNEVRELSIENAILVHFLRDGSLSS